MRRRHPLSDAAQEYRGAMWALAAAAALAFGLSFAGVRGSVPRLVGLAGLGLGMACACMAFFFGLRAHRRALADQEISARRSMIVLLAAQLGTRDDDVLAGIARRGGPAAEAASLILQGRRERLRGTSKPG